MRERAWPVCTPQIDPGLQAAWIALVKATPVEALTSALSKELVSNFFSLGGAPSGQSLPPQLMFTPDLEIQVISAMGISLNNYETCLFCLPESHTD